MIFTAKICMAVMIALSTLLFGSGRLYLHAQDVCPNPYIVQPKDSWTGIAKKCGVSYPDLRTANLPLWQQRDVNIHPGDQLEIPITIDTPERSAASEPITTIQAFYAVLEQGLTQSSDPSPAYLYLSSARRAEQSLARFRNAYAKTTHVEILHIKLIEQQAATAKVGVIVVTVDLEQGQPKPYQYDAIYPLVLEAGVWRIGKTVKYDEIGVLSQGALDHWLSNDISQSLPVNGAVEIWHSNTFRVGQDSATYQFTLFSSTATLSNVEIEIALIDANGQRLAEQTLTLERLGGANADWYQIGIINVSNQLKVNHFQILNATAEIDANRIAILTTLHPLLFQPLPIVNDAGVQ